MVPFLVRLFRSPCQDERACSSAEQGGLREACGHVCHTLSFLRRSSCQSCIQAFGLTRVEKVVCCVSLRSLRSRLEFKASFFAGWLSPSLCNGLEPSASVSLSLRGCRRLSKLWFSYSILLHTQLTSIISMVCPTKNGLPTGTLTGACASGFRSLGLVVRALRVHFVRFGFGCKIFYVVGC